MTKPSKELELLWKLDKDLIELSGNSTGQLSEGKQLDLDAHKMCGMLFVAQSRDSVMAGCGLDKNYLDALGHKKRMQEIIDECSSDTSKMESFGSVGGEQYTHIDFNALQKYVAQNRFSAVRFLNDPTKDSNMTYILQDRGVDRDAILLKLEFRPGISVIKKDWVLSVKENSEWVYVSLSDGQTVQLIKNNGVQIR